MKTSLFNSILCASLLVFAVGCGKNSSGGKKSNQYYNGLTQTSQQAMQSLESWYNSQDVGYPGLGQFNAQKVVSVYNTQPSCEDKKFLGIPYQFCTFNGSPSTNQTTMQVTIVPGTVISKTNPELQAAMRPASNMTLTNARTVDSYRVELTYLNTTDGTVTVYGINKGKSSQLNPEFKRVTSQTQRTDTLINYSSPF